jgi:hypothetical protein
MRHITRSKTVALAILLCSFVALPSVVYAAIPFFGPVIPPEASICPGSWALVITVINNVIQLAITLLIVLVAPIMFAYAGFKILANPASPGARTEAKKMLLNLFGGIALSLGAWVLVDAFMAVLYKPDAAGGVWYSIINSGGLPICLIQEGALFQLNQVPQSNITGVTPAGTGVYLDGKGAALCADDNTACSPAALQAAGFDATSAKVMACIAFTENSGRSTGCNGNACGTFQIMLTVNRLKGPACAKYNNGNPTIECNKLCRGANGVAVKTEASCQPCVQAANDEQCNAQSAYELYRTSGYGPWTTASDNKKSGGCIAAYGSGA